MAVPYLHIEIKDGSCADDEAFIFKLPLETSKVDIMMSIECLYPTTNAIHMEVVDGTEEPE